MSLQINNSPDISNLSVKVTWDLSGVLPLILLENLSEGNNLSAVDYAFTAISPTTTYIHQGNIDDPDESGIWSEATLSDAWPRPFNQIEWGLYQFFVTAKDSEGNIFTAPVQEKNICRPTGNFPDSKTTYGLGSVLVQTKCEQARIYFQDTTNTSYKGITGTVGSSVLRVNFPMDNTGTVPSPFQINYFSSAMVPITYSGKGYQFLYTSIYDYDLGDEVHVRIKYLLNDTFSVWCNIDLMPLICEYQKLIDSVENGSCGDVNEANRKLMLINPKFSLVIIGIFQPLTGIDVPEVIEEIKEIGGFDCDCCSAASGVLPVGSSAFDGYTFSVVPLGGDVEGEFVVNGYNIQLQVSDVSYIFRICDSSPTETTAFEVRTTTSGDGYTKTYCLYVDMVQLAEDLLNTITDNAGLVNLFNTIVSANPGGFNLLVDGKCIFSSSTAYNYLFSLTNIPPGPINAQITGIEVDGVMNSLSYFFNMGTLPALQAYLNTLGHGTFVVAATGAATISITSTANTTNIGAVNYSALGVNLIATMTKTASGFVALTANQVVQMIINYLCDLDDSKIVTSAEYEVCYVDEAGDKQIETVDAGESLADFLNSLTTRGCTTIDYIVSLKSVNCANIKEQFPQVTTEVMQANDILLGTKNGVCAGLYPNEAFLMMLTYGPYDATVLAAFCNMVTLCAAGKSCDPYNVFYAEVNDGSPTAELVVTFDHPLAVSNTIRYARIDNTVSPVYTTVTGVLPGDSPKTITGIDNGQYRVGITPIYADGRSCPELFYDTLPCTAPSAFSATYVDPDIKVLFMVDELINYAKVNISYPNGGSFSQVYDKSTLPTEDDMYRIDITPPANVYGTFFATLQSGCDSDTGYFSSPTAPAAFEIEEASP